MIEGLFVTATGTGVGKTLVTAGVLRNLRRRGVAAMAMKPVQTGAAPDAQGRLDAPDLAFVRQAAGLEMDEATCALAAPFLYEPACSPHLAARLAGRPIRFERILDCAKKLAARHEMLVVEGAGGLMVPLGEDGMMIDLAAALCLPVLLVAQSGLGTINHTLLSLEALRHRGLRVLGVILNDTQPLNESERFIHDDNANAIATFGGAPVLARIPWLGAPPALDRLDDALASCDFATIARSRSPLRTKS